VAKQGILLRKYGQEVIRLTAGKRVHGTGSIPGGVNKSLTAEERDLLLKDAYQMVAWSRDAVHLIKKLHQANPALYDVFGAFDSSLMSIVGLRGEMDFYHGSLRAKDAAGKAIFDGVDYCTYSDLIGEEVKPWSYMKFPFLRSLGKEKGWYKVGPLARVQNCDSIPTPLAEIERREFVAYGKGRPIHAPLAYHWARMIEMLHSAETIKDLLHDPDITGSDLMVTGERRREGVGVIEAPRGTLFHHYRVDEDDVVTMCNLIVSTTNNNNAMNEAVRTVASQYLDGRELNEGLLNHIEVAIRAFDPCLSCATHALGKMPMVVELLGPDGQELDRIARSADGRATRDLPA
jgi:NAD-reducing hydrogenase large subunit